MTVQVGGGGAVVIALSYQNRRLGERAHERSAGALTESGGDLSRSRALLLAAQQGIEHRRQADEDGRKRRVQKPGYEVDAGYGAHDLDHENGGKGHAKRGFQHPPPPPPGPTRPALHAPPPRP